MLLLLCASLLCWGLLPQAQGWAQHRIALQISKKQLEAEISDLFSEHPVLHRLTKIPLTGAEDGGVAILNHLPFVKEHLSKKKSGLHLSMGKLLSKESLLGEMLRTSGLLIEDAQGQEVHLEILTDALIQLTLRNKLYLTLPQVLRLEMLKNIRIGARLEQMGNKTQVKLEECYTPPGYLSIKVLEQMNPLLVNESLLLITSTLDEALPNLLQKIVCPVTETLLNLLLEDLLHLTLPPTFMGPEDFQYYVTTTELTEDAILMHVQLFTPCGPGKKPLKPAYQVDKHLPKLTQGSMADLVFHLETYNDILFCLYTSKEIYVDPQDSNFAELTRMLVQRELEPGLTAAESPSEALKLVLRAPQPPRVHLDGHTATVTQSGSLTLARPNKTSQATVLWKLSAKAEFPPTNSEKLMLQMDMKSASLSLVHYPTGLTEKKYLEASVLELLKRTFMPSHNELLGKQGLPLPSIKGLSFGKAHREFSEDHLLLAVPEK